MVPEYNVRNGLACVRKVLVIFVYAAIVFGGIHKRLFLLSIHDGTNDHEFCRDFENINTSCASIVGLIIDLVKSLEPISRMIKWGYLVVITDLRADFKNETLHPDKCGLSIFPVKIKGQIIAIQNVVVVLKESLEVPHERVTCHYNAQIGAHCWSANALKLLPLNFDAS